MNVEVLPHDFCKLQPLKLYRIVQEPFFQAWKLFSAEIWKMLECHFWANVMLRQSRLWASRASPAQKLQDLRVVYSKNFSRATFFVFWVTYLVDIYLNKIPMKQIWWKSAVWGWGRNMPKTAFFSYCLCPKTSAEMPQIVLLHSVSIWQFTFHKFHRIHKSSQIFIEVQGLTATVSLFFIIFPFVALAL